MPESHSTLCTCAVAGAQCRGGPVGPIRGNVLSDLRPFRRNTCREFFPANPGLPQTRRESSAVALNSCGGPRGEICLDACEGKGRLGQVRCHTTNVVYRRRTGSAMNVTQEGGRPAPKLPENFRAGPFLAQSRTLTAPVVLPRPLNLVHKGSAPNNLSVAWSLSCGCASDFAIRSALIAENWRTIKSRIVSTGWVASTL